MLISRGPVYKTARSATMAADGHRFHDNCHCVAEPVFDGETWDGREQFAHYQQLWNDSTAGLSTDDARSAFRQALAA
jgi:hypothetical protein